MHAKKLVSLTVAALIALGASIVACSSATEGGVSCDTVCGGMGDCAGTSCLAECLSLQVGCNQSSKAGAVEAFNDFASCPPAIICGATGYQVTNCPLAQIEIATRCSVTSTMISPPGMPDGGIILPPRDAGTDGPVIIFGDSGLDTGTCGICQSDCTDECGACSGGDCASADDSGVDSGCGVCQSNCENDCGACTGGDCETTVDSGCGTCGTACEDDCGNPCTGGECTSSDDSGCGICGTDCEDSCGNTCTGGDCSSCVSTGCSNCTTDCDDSISCDDNCGNPCC